MASVRGFLNIQSLNEHTHVRECVFFRFFVTLFRLHSRYSGEKRSEVRRGDDRQTPDGGEPVSPEIFTDLCHRLTNSNLMPCFARAAIQMSPLGGLGAAAVKHTTRAHGRARLTFSYHTPGDVMYRGC